MKVVLYYKFGAPDVLRIEEIEKPVPNDNEVMIEVVATTVTSGDCHMRSGTPFAARLFAGPITPKNKILGTVLSGIVVAIGRTVTRFNIGDPVIASRGMVSGAHAQFVTMPEDGVIILKNESLSFEEAAAWPFGALTAKSTLERAQISKGKKVLVIGAAGNVGSAAIQLAKSHGAIVTGICGTSSMRYVKNLGADCIIDYKKQSITDDTHQYDIILDTVGNSSVAKLKKRLNYGGVYITIAINVSVFLQMLLPSRAHKKVIFDITKADSSDLTYFSELIERGVYKPQIEAVYELESVKKAHEHMGKKSKQGSVILKMK